MNEIEIFFQFHTWFIFLVSYLAGSIPFGLLFTQWAGLGDVRTIGSGNIGATNVLRTKNKKIAALTLFFDILKGTVVVVAAKFFSFSAESNIIVLTGFFAFLGHLFPIWLKFKGGKGVSTYLGVCIGLYWPAAIVFAAIWLTFFLFTRYSSLSSLITTIVVPIFVYFSCPCLYTRCTMLVMSIFVVAKHRANINRLLIGKESKIDT
ncbi:glycerol-3-phosphate 1-O-acyltransferase PlsY [Bartonella sp. CB178]|uniref:glycerol-3-phosphate 1-O-acyltransferase PlsY n=1 Tax=Bartonella sp. CB178 TaxID=3112255 RepID=UPI00300E415B